MNENSNDSGFFDQNKSSNLKGEETKIVLDKNSPEKEWKSENDSGNEVEKSKSKPKGAVLNIHSSQPSGSSGSSYKKKFLWPEKFLTRETRKDSKPVEPIEPKDIVKQSSRPFFGQVMESLGPRLNTNEQKSWNLCFKIGRNCSSMVIWFRVGNQELG